MPSRAACVSQRRSGESSNAPRNQPPSKEVTGCMLRKADVRFKMMSGRVSAFFMNGGHFPAAGLCCKTHWPIELQLGFLLHDKFKHPTVRIAMTYVVLRIRIPYFVPRYGCKVVNHHPALAVSDMEYQKAYRTIKDRGSWFSRECASLGCESKSPPIGTRSTSLLLEAASWTIVKGSADVTYLDSVRYGVRSTEHSWTAAGLPRTLGSVLVGKTQRGGQNKQRPCFGVFWCKPPYRKISGFFFLGLDFGKLRSATVRITLPYLSAVGLTEGGRGKKETPLGPTCDQLQVPVLVLRTICTLRSIMAGSTLSCCCYPLNLFFSFCLFLVATLGSSSPAAFDPPFQRRHAQCLVSFRPL